jgi:hypothetical protein
LIMPSQATPIPLTSGQSFQGRNSATDSIALNRELDEQAALGPASEEFLLNLLDLLLEGEREETPDLWPTLARLAELALYSAGCLALAGEFAACGDLLINPGGKLLHVKGSLQPFKIKRHKALTSQVAHLVPEGWRAIEWLKQETILELPQKALLPRLRDELENWADSKDYLDQLKRDCEALASGLVLLAGLESGSCASLPETMASLPWREREWLESQIFRPNLKRFHELKALLQYPDCQTNPSGDNPTIPFVF